MTVTPPAAYVTPGQQVQLTATVKDAAGNTLTAPVTWVSGNSAVATVNPVGLVMAITSGVVSITATSEGQSAVAYINILEEVFLVATVSAGNNHTCALIANGGFPGTACCWGDNSFGQLGDGTGINQSAPVCLNSFIIGEGLPVYSSISAGGDHTCAIQQVSGAAFCWGDNSSGELGNGTTTISTGPVLVSGGHSFAALSAGAHHTCGVSGATMYCWGENTYGQLGNGTTISSSVPVPVVNQFPWNGIVSAGSNHTCAVDVEAGVLVNKCWGDNSSGQLGNGTTTNSTTPAPVYGATGVLALSIGTLYGCAIGSPPPSLGFQISCWGDNSAGQLGNGTMTNSDVPVSVSGGLNFVTVSTGAMHACGTVASSTNGTPFSYAYCWGDNNSGQLGNGSNTNSATPILVAGGLSFASVSAGRNHTCAVTSSSAPGPTAGGGVYCWGDNAYGQLGNFLLPTSSSVPVNVAGPQ